MTMILNYRVAIVGLLALAVVILGLSEPARADSEQQQLVDRARLAVDTMKSDTYAETIRAYVQSARAIVIIPEFVKAGFIIGGAYGKGLIIARDAAVGDWSSPAFMELVEGSIGLQIGGESAEIFMTVRSDDGLKALLSNQFTIGGEAGITVLTMGAKREAATTTNLEADIITFGRGKGLFGGVSLDGAKLIMKADDNAAYYGQAVSAEDIVIHRKVGNVNADGLRNALRGF
jgi:lipid-binding SYLF domain-containing protein